MIPVALVATAGVAVARADRDGRADPAPVPRAVVAADGCKLSHGVRIVHLDNTATDGDPATDVLVLRHAWRAQAREGVPVVWTLKRAEADANRRASTSQLPSWGTLSRAAKMTALRDQGIEPVALWTKDHDRDEVPPAVADEGGRRADVAYIVSSANRAAGSTMGAQLAGCPDGTRFRYQLKPGRKARG